MRAYLGVLEAEQPRLHRSRLKSLARLRLPTPSSPTHLPSLDLLLCLLVMVQFSPFCNDGNKISTSVFLIFLISGHSFASRKGVKKIQLSFLSSYVKLSFLSFPTVQGSLFRLSRFHVIVFLHSFVCSCILRAFFHTSQYYALIKVLCLTNERERTFDKHIVLIFHLV